MQIIRINTERYAGNFERELCAYVTGQYGDCGVGDLIAQGARKSIKNLVWFEHHLQWEPDEFDCHRPVVIQTTDGWFNNGMGKCYKIQGADFERAKDEAVETYRAYHASVLEEKSQEFYANYRATWHGWPAWNTVGILVDDLPVPAEVMIEIRKRALAFCRFRRIPLISVDDPIHYNTTIH
jgi:hypothetical protein